MQGAFTPGCFQLIVWLIIIVALVAVAGWAVVRHLPETEANADVAVNKPIDRMQEVRSVAFDGYQIPASALRTLIDTQPGKQLDTTRLEHDRATLEQALAGRGYLAAKVSPAEVTFDAAGAAYVRFEIDKGRMFRLRTVDVSAAAKDAAVVTLAAGDDAIRERIDQAREALSQALIRRGKSGDVDLSIHTDIAANAVDVRFATR